MSRRCVTAPTLGFLVFYNYSWYLARTSVFEALLRYPRCLPSPGQLWKVRLYHPLWHGFEPLPHREDYGDDGTVHRVCKHQQYLLQHLGRHYGLE